MRRARQRQGRTKAVRRRSRITGQTGEHVTTEFTTTSQKAEELSFSKAVQLADSVADEARGNDGKIHASSLLYDFCPRRYALANEDRYKSPMPKQRPSSDERLMWAIGRTVEAHIRKNLIISMGRSAFLGRWKCLCGATDKRGQYSEDEATVCPRCLHTTNIYDEYTVRHPELPVFGNPDMVHIGADGALTVLEIKSIKKKGDGGFDELLGAKTTHILQACMYRRLLAEEGYRVSPKVYVLYGSKDFSFQGSPYKEYPVNATDYDRLVDNLFDQARVALQTTPLLPDRLPVCSAPTTPRAKKCDACALCHNLRA